jgi:hypothetical protein
VLGVKPTACHFACYQLFSTAIPIKTGSAEHLKSSAEGGNKVKRKWPILFWKYCKPAELQTGIQFFCQGRPEQIKIHIRFAAPVKSAASRLRRRRIACIYLGVDFK